MAARRFWPRISALGLGLALLALAGAAVLRYGSALRWAASELPTYLSGHIGSPPERRMYRQAREMLREGGDLAAAQALLEQAAAIDPTSQAVYLLGEVYLATGHPEEALPRFKRYMDLDPTEDGSYLKAAAILEDLGRVEDARVVLRRGLDYLTTERERQVPRPDPGVEARFNARAIEAYEAYGASIDRLSAELSRLGEPVPR